MNMNQSGAVQAIWQQPMTWQNASVLFLFALGTCALPLMYGGSVWYLSLLQIESVGTLNLLDFVFADSTLG